MHLLYTPTNPAIIYTSLTPSLWFDRRKPHHIHLCHTLTAMLIAPPHTHTQMEKNTPTKPLSVLFLFHFIHSLLNTAHTQWCEGQALGVCILLSSSFRIQIIDTVYWYHTLMCLFWWTDDDVIFHLVISSCYYSKTSVALVMHVLPTQTAETNQHLYHILYIFAWVQRFHVLYIVCLYLGKYGHGTGQYSVRRDCEMRLLL